MKHDWNGPRSTLPRLTSPTSVPSRRKMPKPYAVSNWRWRSHAPQRARNASRSTTGSRRARLGQRLPRLEPVAAADADLAPGVVVAHLERPQHHPRAGERRLATSSHFRAKVIHYPDPVPTNGTDHRQRRPAGLARPRDDRPRRRPSRDRRDRGARHRRRARARSTTASTSSCTSRPSALAEMDDFVRTMHTKSALLPEIEASTISLADAGAQALEYIRAPRARARRPRRCAATRSASTAGSSTTSSPSSTATCTTAASTCRASRSSAGAGTPTCTRSGRGKAETHRALADVQESIAELRYYREHMLRRADGDQRRADRATRHAEQLAQRAEERGHRALARGVAHEADAPRLARRTRRARRRPRCRRWSSSALRSVASSAPSGSHAVVSSGRRWPSGTTRRKPSSGSASWRRAPTARWRAHAASRPSSSTAPSAACSAQTIATGAVWWYTRLAPPT